MRKSTVVLRGAKPTRRDSIASLFSSAGTEVDTAPPSPGRFAGLLRRLSGRASIIVDANSPTSPKTIRELAEQEKDTYPPADLPNAPSTSRRRSRSQSLMMHTMQEKDIVLEQMEEAPHAQLPTLDMGDGSLGLDHDRRGGAVV